MEWRQLKLRCAILAAANSCLASAPDPDLLVEGAGWDRSVRAAADFRTHEHARNLALLAFQKRVHLPGEHRHTVHLGND
jgi:hypothetical protein